MTAAIPMRIACVGLASWDRFLAVPRYPAAGEYQVVSAELEAAGGTTASTAAALARLGASVRLAAVVGDDREGAAIRDALAAQGVDVTWVASRPGARTDLSTMIVSADPPERTIFWSRGAELVRGDRLDVTAIFDHDLVVLDVADAPLRRFLTDLPAHTSPRARLLGTLGYLVEDAFHDAFDVALRHDVIVGNERELLAVTGTWTLSDAVTAVAARMRGAHLRGCIVTRGANGCRIVTPDGRWQVPAFPVDAVDPTGAGDAFTAGVAYGLAHRWDWPRIGRFANALGALATRALGAQTTLPTLTDVEALLAAGESAPRRDDLGE